MSGLLPSVSVQGITDLNTNLVNIQRTLSALFQAIGTISITVGVIPAGELYGNPGPGTIAPVGVIPTGGIQLDGTGHVLVQWNAGTVNTIGTGLAIVGTQLQNTGASQWTAGTVNAVAPGLSIIGTTLTPTSPAGSQTNVASPTGTTSLVGVMMGLTGTLTPVTTGNALIIVSGDIQNASGAGDGGNVQIRFGPGAAPTNGAALAGTTAGGKQRFVSATPAEIAPFSVNARITGLTLSTPVWIDVALAAITAGTATISNVSVSVMEI